MWSLREPTRKLKLRSCEGRRSLPWRIHPQSLPLSTFKLSLLCTLTKSASSAYLLTCGIHEWVRKKTENWTHFTWTWKHDDDDTAQSLMKQAKLGDNEMQIKHNLNWKSHEFAGSKFSFLLLDFDTIAGLWRWTWEGFVVVWWKWDEKEPLVIGRNDINLRLISYSNTQNDKEIEFNLFAFHSDISILSIFLFSIDEKLSPRPFFSELRNYTYHPSLPLVCFAKIFFMFLEIFEFKMGINCDMKLQNCGSPSEAYLHQIVVSLAYLSPNFPSLMSQQHRAKLSKTRDLLRGWKSTVKLNLMHSHTLTGFPRCDEGRVLR